MSTKDNGGKYGGLEQKSTRKFSMMNKFMWYAEENESKLIVTKIVSMIFFYYYASVVTLSSFV